MSLDRVIADQQNRIDELEKRVSDLLEGTKKLLEQNAKVFKRHDELFEAWARFLDEDTPDPDGDPKKWERYCSLRHEVRMQMLDTGYCLRCYDFICTCDEHGY